MPKKDQPQIATTLAWRAVMKAAREAKGLNLRDLGEQIGVSHTMLGAIERGEIRSSSQVPAICEALEIAPPVIMENDEIEQWVELGRLLRARDQAGFKELMRGLKRLTAP